MNEAPIVHRRGYVGRLAQLSLSRDELTQELEYVRGKQVELQHEAAQLLKRAEHYTRISIPALYARELGIASQVDALNRQVTEIEPLALEEKEIEAKRLRIRELKAELAALED